ncbi:MAG: hypothetical protein ACO22K_11105 [Woeseiaceae bacterium]
MPKRNGWNLPIGTAPVEVPVDSVNGFPKKGFMAIFRYLGQRCRRPKKD